MKLALVVNSYPPRVGGLEQHLGNLAQGLSDLGVDVTVFTVGDQPGVRRDGQVTVRTIRRHFTIADVVSFPAVGATKRLARALRDGGYDAVSVHTRFFPLTFVGVRAAKKAGLPVVHTEHGSGFVASESPVIAAASRLVDETLGRYALRSADRVLGVSDEAADFAASLGAKSPATFFNAIPALQSEPEIVDRPGHLVFVGRVVPGKGWDTFIDAVSRLREQGFDVDAEVLGDGESLEDAREQVRARGLESVVTVRGRVDPLRVREALRGATLLNPTTLSEGFQTTLLEAIAEGGRVVTFPVAGAELLARLGAPVVVTDRRDVDSLVEASAGLLAKPPAPAEDGFIDPWTWPHRSQEYLAILQTLLPG